MANEKVTIDPSKIILSQCNTQVIENYMTYNEITYDKCIKQQWILAFDLLIKCLFREPHLFYFCCNATIYFIKIINSECSTIIAFIP